MPVVSGGGGGGNTTAQVAASGTVLPVANAPGNTVDSTTYADPVEGSGFLTTLVVPTLDHPRAVYACAVSGDAFPRWLQTSDGSNGFYLGDGTFDPYSGGANLAFTNDGTAAGAAGAVLSAGRLRVDAAKTSSQTPQLSQVSPLFTITSGALPTVDFTGQSGVGKQVSVARDVDIYVETGTAGSVVAALSPDNTTYTTIYTKTTLASDVCHARVPAGWYLKLTATTAVLGVGTFA